MTFLADFHIHSRYSRATSKDLSLERLHIAAQTKGIAIVGTGDATHPGWLADIKEKLVPDGDGLFRLRDSLVRTCTPNAISGCRSRVRFVLVSEISNIYKKEGQTRKNHNLVFLPSLETAENFNTRLERIGNIRSDGRPILGLDARDLLEILLETDERAFLIPAHIWTPWFSLLGSKSGFDSLEACFEDLSGHIFAAETGLSSDPPMNRLVSSLDRLTLISNSDAHSPAKLAREANIFHCSPGFKAIREALEKPHNGQFGGTIEFYPEEGKYHLDGHRKCGVSLTPDETRKLNGVCPKCGRALTVGVFNRVQALADRTPETIPEGYPPFESLIPLPEILAEVLQVGPATKTVQRAYQLALATLGNELFILREAPVEQIDTTGIPLLGEAIRRMRSGKVAIKAGYDGEYGQIRIFSDAEKQTLFGQRRLFGGALPNEPCKETRRSAGGRTEEIAASEILERPPAGSSRAKKTEDAADQVNHDQQKAVTHGEGPLLIVAGPGTGKTRTLTHRIAHLIQDGGIPGETMLAVTFTEKAAEEMRSRLTHLLEEGLQPPLTATFHALCWALVNEEQSGLRIIDDEERLFFLQRALHRLSREGRPVALKPQTLLKQIAAAKQQLKGPDAYFESVAPEAPASQFARAYTAYHNFMEDHGFLDFEDLILKVVRRMEADAAYRTALQKRFAYVFVDEYQDLNLGQYRLIRLLVPPGGNLCVIGDPDQAIYGFRGSDVSFFNRFVEDYPDAQVVHLNRNYRSTETILEVSRQVIRHRQEAFSGLGLIGAELYSNLCGVPHVSVVELPSEKAEAVAVGQTIEKAVGGTGFLSIDAGKVDGYGAHDYSFADFAVLYRTARQAEVLSDIFGNAGIPFQTASRRSCYDLPLVATLVSLLKLMGGTASASDVNRIAGFLRPALDQKTIMDLLDVTDERKIDAQHLLECLDEGCFSALPSPRKRRLKEARQDLQNRLAVLLPLSLADRIHHFQPHGYNDPQGISQSEEERVAFERLTALAHHCEGDLERFLASVAMQTDADMVQPRVERVTLSTIHAAKGLEFPVVFVVGCEEGLIPLRHRDGQSVDLDEERRLFYVALTRAQDQVYLTWSRKRRIYGRLEMRERSSFVADIESRLLRYQTPQLTVPRQDSQVQLKLF